VDWDGYIVDDYDFVGFQSRGRVLDVGCGPGAQLAGIAARGSNAIGIDLDRQSLRKCRGEGLRVLCGAAETLPLRDASMDGVICKVVLPYTDEKRVFAEIARVLTVQGEARFCFHGSGYYLRYLLVAPSFKLRFYGLRSLVNTWLYGACGARLPSFLGDTVYQSRRRLRSYYVGRNLIPIDEVAGPTFLGFPVFIYQTVRKAGH
jgi:ubiquinone/menaquinone biosynthesis C-methylase UbiE